MNAIKVIRNNWKKTVAFLGVTAFGVNYGRQKYIERQILTAYCLEAQKYGSTLLKNGARPRKVTVFLNPAANRGKGRDLYEKNIAPILNLAGLEVTLVKTEYEGQAKKFMEVMDPTDAIVIVGGDGTVSEVVTGLLRRQDEEQFAKIPLGVVPVGQTNSLAKSLCPKTDSTVVFLAEMAMSAVKGFTRLVDVIQIKGDEDKCVYAVNGLDWGAFTDGEMRKKRYWYFGPLKHRLTYIVSTLRYWPLTNETDLSYVLPCAGCNRCFTTPPKPKWRWWHLFLPPHTEVVKDFSNVVNEECGKVHQQKVMTAQITARTQNDQQLNSTSSINLDLINGYDSRKEFIKDGWSRMKGEPLSNEQVNLTVKAFNLKPSRLSSQDKEAWFLIDTERFELMNIDCCLLPNKLSFFSADSFSIPLTDFMPSSQ